MLFCPRYSNPTWLLQSNNASSHTSEASIFAEGEYLVTSTKAFASVLFCPRYSNPTWLCEAQRNFAYERSEYLRRRRIPCHLKKGFENFSKPFCLAHSLFSFKHPFANRSDLRYCIQCLQGGLPLFQVRLPQRNNMG